MSEPKPCSIIGKTEEHEGKTRENESAEIARHLLEYHLLDMEVARDNGARRLYYDPLKDLYWELVYMESRWFKKGPPSLIPVPKEDVFRLFNTKPVTPADPIVVGKHTPDHREVPGDPATRIIQHLADQHFVEENRERGGCIRLYRDPTDDSLYEIGHFLVEIPHETARKSGTHAYVGGPTMLRRVSFEEVQQLYKCVNEEDLR